MITKAQSQKFHTTITKPQDGQQTQKAAYQLGDRTEEMTFDGKIEDSIVDQTKWGDVFAKHLVTNLDDAQTMVTSKEAEEAKNQLDSGKKEVKVNYQDETWTGFKTESGGFGFIKDGLVGGYKNEVRTRGDKTSVEMSGFTAEGGSYSQRVVGSMNSNGTITCDLESVQYSSPFQSVDL